MSKILTCPKCHQKLKVPSELHGKKVKCPGCSSVFRLGPKPNPTPSSPAPAAIPNPFETTTQPSIPSSISPNPYSPPTAFSKPISHAPSRRGPYGGIRRLPYVGFIFLAVVIYQIVVFGIMICFGPHGIFLVVPALLLYVCVIMFIVSQRMINCGYTPWWCLGTIVPILNFLVAFRALACPEGYADHKTLDTPAKVIAGLFITFLVLSVLAFFGALARTF